VYVWLLDLGTQKMRLQFAHGLSLLTKEQQPSHVIMKELRSGFIRVLCIFINLKYVVGCRHDRLPCHVIWRIKEHSCDVVNHGYFAFSFLAVVDCHVKIFMYFTACDG
jgi:hypothetical protein